MTGAQVKKKLCIHVPIFQNSSDHNMNDYIIRLNKNIDIKFSAHKNDLFLDKKSLKIPKGGNQNL
jgi:hypothetical protein